jgi:hypothetical protein
VDKIRVIVYGEGLMMGTVVESLASRHHAIDVFGIQADDPDELFRAISLHKPNALVLSRDMPNEDQKRLASVLTDYPEIQLILFNPDDNWLRVYQRRDVLIKDPVELLHMILDPGIID